MASVAGWTTDGGRTLLSMGAGADIDRERGMTASGSISDRRCIGRSRAKLTRPVAVALAIAFTFCAFAAVFFSGLSGAHHDRAPSVPKLDDSTAFSVPEGTAEASERATSRSVPNQHPDPMHYPYADWECSLICRGVSYVAVAGGSGCCQYTKNAAGVQCMFTKDGTIDEKGYSEDSVAFSVVPWTQEGGGQIAKTGWGKACTGGTPVRALEPPPSTGSPARDPHSYDVVWHDDFNDCPGGVPNPNDWGYEAVQRQHRLAWLTTENAACIDSNLVISARKEKPDAAEWRGASNPKDFNYTTSSLTSHGKPSRNYKLGGCGKVEFRAKLDTRVGGFPAWWSMADVNMQWPGTGEIDMMEYAGGTGWIKTNYCHIKNGTGDASGSVASGGECLWNTVVKAVDEAWSQEFHTWTMRWDEAKDEIVTLLDGYVINTETFSCADPKNTGHMNPWRGHDHFFIIGNQVGMLGGNPEHTTYPMDLVVDYVGYWTCRSSS